MAKDLEKTLVKTVLGFFTAIGVYVAGVAIYSIFTWSSFIYNLGYSLGYVAGTISSWL